MKMHLPLVALTFGCAPGTDSGAGAAGTPEMGLVADFLLEDLNPTSPRSGDVSPWRLVFATSTLPPFSFIPTKRGS